MPVDYKEYPANWKTEIRPAILKRAKNKCERCGVENGDVGYRDKYGEFWGGTSLIDFPGHIIDEAFDGVPEEKAYKPITIVLTIAHIANPDPMDCRPENLSALCQRCHFKSHDTPQHRAWTRKKYDAKVGQLRLFDNET